MQAEQRGGETAELEDGEFESVFIQHTDLFDYAGLNIGTPLKAGRDSLTHNITAGTSLHTLPLSLINPCPVTSLWKPTGEGGATLCSMQGVPRGCLF
jgi:hypothetical protein